MLYTVKEAAMVLRISPWSLRQKLRTGALRMTRFGPRQIRISKLDLETYVSNNASLPSPVGAPAAPPARPNAAVSPPAAPSPASAPSAP